MLAAGTTTTAVMGSAGSVCSWSTDTLTDTMGARGVRTGSTKVARMVEGEVAEGASTSHCTSWGAGGGRQ